MTVNQSNLANNKALIGMYIGLLREIRLRMYSSKAVNDLSLAKGLSSQASLEYGYFQTRMSCELLAIACLAVHNDIQGLAGLRKQYHPNLIVKKLGALHPEFYPQPLHCTHTVGGSPVFREITSGFLTKDELVAVWNECGGHLHHTTLKHLLIDQPSQPDFHPLMEMHRKMSTLLGWHRIKLSTGIVLIVGFPPGDLKAAPIVLEQLEQQP